ncbi:hypothetical protein A3C98_03105 [Candidatus Roizmanbacteria bacterium RIFCSPHIGHO2_02_FULL_37_15]|uniref:Aminotransferase class I/classII domain-containing protein n=1 Tax=Candidatus Roizmanbacteria bacterium RIFCSPLOWO2_01_FULL_37_16 TaxID=1802058 RepID=A0A1F7IJ48_9BACT|nr:MAG: hypothetical protein A2859_01165 [Candidatus Roizmanbacteria bacterium RIFCSPHIGHO2_01_FULL_37_16b]OGK21082.1 MAG: hypothetical protein A3C98_03105 [Candidatus Roizmanbacteria bacterium RIFCSPHIGHO2_02_FULL_37_15]OGK31423.1 MAG: hypothetical protein A3F57_01370 [Candidatus Roizmanbacteria bacterium RIFCSPHIGHO2_12_FULL_36_11]OGK43364.1 MAG: hypothetical protein A3B40_01040 [Candidatus Roizmanbacteria bacterium RIFCSPLOWO2_01_FULL_37_16]
MISTDFAPNESWDDAWISLKLIFQPWRWKNGEESKLIKQKICNLLNVPCFKLHVSLFLSGRSALYFFLKSLNLPPDSEVIVQAFTCEAVVLPILANNLKPVYIDIEAETFSMNYKKLIDQIPKRAKVLILQHTFGLTPKFRDEIIKFAHENKLIIIEDLAHGFNPVIFKTSNIQPPTSNFYLFSFGRSKLLSSVFGGVIVSSNNTAIKHYNNLTMPSSFFIFHCLLYKPLTTLIKSTYDIYFGKILHKILYKLKLLIPEITEKEKSGYFDESFNKAYPNALAILLLHQFNKFEQIQQQRLKICQVYSGQISKYQYLISKQIANHQVPPIKHPLIRFPLLARNRNAILSNLKKYKIYLGKWYDQAVAPKELELSRVGYKRNSCPVAEEICQKIINLPTNISERDAIKIIKKLARIKSKD